MKIPKDIIQTVRGKNVKLTDEKEQSKTGS